MVTILSPEATGRFPEQGKEVVLSVDGVSKKFCRDLKRSLFYGLQDISLELLGLREESDRLRPKEFWALSNVNLQLKRGEALGLIGRNGSGKSTLLRIISGLIKPDAGSVTVKGRIAPLIALGAGFNPILTGRENIYANMSILGLTQRQITQRFDAVVDFAEIDVAIDSPVQTYSSGMAARLGFACAIHTEPDILVLDEVLAVGDVRFRGKCYRRLAKLREQGISFILVSHSPNSIVSLCETAAYLLNGQVQVVGDTTEVMRKYESDLFVSDAVEVVGKLVLPAKPASESVGADITSIAFRDQRGNIMPVLSSGEPARLCVTCKVHKRLEDVRLAISMKEKFAESDRVLSLSNGKDNVRLNLSPGSHQIEMEMPYVGMRPGSYFIDLNIRQGPMEILDTVQGFNFNVESDSVMSKCNFYQPRTWKATEAVE